MGKYKNWKRRVYNEKCHKTSYATKADADQDALKAVLNPDSDVTMLGAYKCPRCKWWHLSKSIQHKQKMVCIQK